MKNVIGLVLVFGIFFAGCAEKSADSVVVSLTDEKVPDTIAVENPVEPVNVQETTSQGATKQENEYREPDVIFVPTPQDVVDKMLELAQVKKDDLLYDLGCGDGRIVVTAAKKYSCKAIGYDIDPERVKESLENVQKNNVGHLAAIEQKDIFTLDLKQANVITLYLLPSLNVKLIPQLEKLKPGSRIVSHDFRMRGIKPDKVVKLHSKEDDDEHRIYLWTTPLTKREKKNQDSPQDNLLSMVQSSPAIAVGMDTSEWISLFDGSTLNGWKAGDNSDSFSVRDGMIVADGPRSHLFYAGSVEGHDFMNFELKLDVKTIPKANSGIYFHTEYQQAGFPAKGYEVQINNTHPGAEGYRELRKTGSLYGVRDVFVSCVKDEVWFTVHIIVESRRIRVYIDGRLLVDYIEPDDPVRAGPDRGRKLSHGTFALQGFGEGSVVYFRNIRVMLLPRGRGLDSRSAEEIAYEKRISEFHASDLPLIDYHIHLKGGLTLEEALEKSRAAGITYGIAENCGLGFPVTNDEQLKQSFDRLEGRPVFKAMQAEGREWVNMFSPEMIAKFDYVFSDALTFHDKQGRRTRLWMANEVHIDDEQEFMDMYVDKIVTILEDEPIDIFVNPTFLPAVIAERYDELWTQQRMLKVARAAVKNGVAIEINARYRIPSVEFIKLAKQAGAKFAFGTNNGGRELGHLEYSLDVAQQCGLTKDDMFVPKPYGEKPIQIKKRR